MSENKPRRARTATAGRYYQALREMAAAVNSPAPPRQTLDVIVRGAARTASATGCSILLLSPGGGQLVHHASYGLSDWYLRKGLLDAEKSLADTLQGEVVAIGDVSTDPRLQYPESAARAGIVSLVSVPLRARGEVIGALRAYFRERREFPSNELEFFAAVADIAGLALENVRLYDSLQKEYTMARAELMEVDRERERVSRPAAQSVSFAHPSEEEFARLLDFYRIEWIYEPRSFPLRWDDEKVVEMFTPDFYLPGLDLYVELTTMKQSLVTEKNRKVRLLKELYPQTNVRLLYKRDYDRLLTKYGYGPLAESKMVGVGRLLFDAARIQRRVRQLARQISRDYAGKHVLLVGVLRGMICFMADLMRQISLPVSVEFMAISYYAGDVGGAVRITKDLDRPIAGMHVIMVEDIVDTGMTLNYLLNYLRARGPASLEVCTLLDKRARRLVDVPLRYVGFQVGDDFVVGYGLDYGEEYRNLPFIAGMQPETRPESGGNGRPE